ncbi:hypothetical protein Cadr_000013884 [Camelus dromedarius]|uniref:Uncharacterized protein n=1 Tax=Camelus dromedarius TaxID=9838 RepID=A0A5N4DCL9_CAMDR|nr:hypothetical protein Cadr_000013884 [Camelus dromedarius]
MLLWLPDGFLTEGRNGKQVRSGPSNQRSTLVDVGSVAGPHDCRPEARQRRAGAQGAKMGVWAGLSEERMREEWAVGTEASMKKEGQVGRVLGGRGAGGGLVQRNRRGLDHGTTVVAQGRGARDQDGGSRGGKIWPADRLDVGPGREKGMKGNSRVLSLSSWVGLRGETRSSARSCDACEMLGPPDHSHHEFSLTAWYLPFLLSALLPWLLVPKVPRRMAVTAGPSVPLGQAADGSSKQSGQRRPQGKGGASVGLEEGMERGCTKDETLLIRSRPSDQSPHNGSYEVQSILPGGNQEHLLLGTEQAVPDETRPTHILPPGLWLPFPSLLLPSSTPLTPCSSSRATSELLGLAWPACGELRSRPTQPTPYFTSSLPTKALPRVLSLLTLLPTPATEEHHQRGMIHSAEEDGSFVSAFFTCPPTAVMDTCMTSQTTRLSQVWCGGCKGNCRVPSNHWQVLRHPRDRDREAQREGGKDEKETSRGRDQKREGDANRQEAIKRMVCREGAKPAKNAGSWGSLVGSGLISCGRCNKRRNRFWPLLASGGCRPSLTWDHITPVCLCGHISLCFPLIRMHVPAFQVHPGTPG